MRIVVIAALLGLAACTSATVATPPPAPDESVIDRSDPRFAACGGNDDVSAAFAFEAASDYRQHFPRMGRAPELEVADPAFAIVFGEDYVPAVLGGVAAGPAVPGTRYVCVYVGQPPNGTHNVYGDVDITGMEP